MSYFPKRYRAIILLFCSTSFLLPQAISSPIINEFVALNRSTLYDEDGQSSDWIEIYNPNSNTIDLEGHFLTNDSDNLKKWKFLKWSENRFYTTRLKAYDVVRTLKHVLQSKKFIKAII